MVGDYRLSTSCNTNRWATAATIYANRPGALGTGYGTTAAATQLNELDYTQSVLGYAAGGNPLYYPVSNFSASTTGNCFGSNLGSACYASAIDLETSNGVEISGLNAEEQSDIAFNAYWSSPQQNFNIEVFSYFDAMIVLKENNVTHYTFFKNY